MNPKTQTQKQVQTQRQTQTLLTIKEVKKSFGGIKALDGCSLEIHKGKIIAIIGPNGSGKSTLFDVISRLLKKDHGSISLHGKDITGLQDYQIARHGVSRTFQHVRLFPNLTLKEHMDIALANNDESLLNSLFRKRKDTLPQIKEILAFVGLKKPLSTYGSDLSYGQRKLLDLAMAIAKPHTLLLLDEPVAGINPHLRTAIKKIITQLNVKGETIVLIEHDMNFVMGLADHIFVMDYGKIIAAGKPKQIQNNKEVLNAYLGEC